MTSSFVLEPWEVSSGPEERKQVEWANAGLSGRGGGGGKKEACIGGGGIYRTLRIGTLPSC